MKIGDTVTTERRMIKVPTLKNYGDAVEWQSIPIFGHHRYVYLGWVIKYNGYWSRDDYGNRESFVGRKPLKLLVLQKIDKDRWTKPIFALPGDVSLICQ